MLLSILKLFDEIGKLSKKSSKFPKTIGLISKINNEELISDIFGTQKITESKFSSIFFRKILVSRQTNFISGSFTVEKSWLSWY